MRPVPSREGQRTPPQALPGRPRGRRRTRGSSATSSVSRGPIGARHPPSLRQGEPPRGRSGRGGTASAHATDRRAGGESEFPPLQGRASERGAAPRSVQRPPVPLCRENSSLLTPSVGVPARSHHWPVISSDRRLFDFLVDHGEIASEGGSLRADEDSGRGLHRGRLPSLPSRTERRSEHEGDHQLHGPRRR